MVLAILSKIYNQNKNSYSHISSISITLYCIYILQPQAKVWNIWKHKILNRLEMYHKTPTQHHKSAIFPEEPRSL